MSAVAALALDGQCTPSTSAEALDGNQADSGTCSPTTNAEVTESTEVRNGNVSSAFNATDLETADVDGKRRVNPLTVSVLRRCARNKICRWPSVFTWAVYLAACLLCLRPR